MKNKFFQSACFLTFILISVSGFSQNLIKNPGFESDKTNWSGFWSKEGTGNATIVTSPVHLGSKAIEIEYPGTQDWAFTSAAKIPVTPGSTFDMSCWTQISALTSEVHFSVVLYNDSQSVVNWIYSPIIMDQKSSAYTQFSTTFIVPEGIKYIQPRFEGWGSCTLFADDVSLAASTSAGITGDFTIENEQVEAVIKLPVFSINLTNKSSAKSYQTGWAQFAVARSAEQISPQILRVKAEMLNEAKSEVTVEFALEGKALKMTISGDSSMIFNSDIQFPREIASQSGDYLIVPRGTGIMFPVSSNNPFGDFNTFSWKSTMPFVGATNLKDGYMIVTDDQWDATFQFEKPSGQSNYSFQLDQKPAKNVLSYNRTSYIVLVDNGYLEMCSWYRDHAEKLGYVKTFEQKKDENPNIDKLIGAVDFWPLSMNVTPDFLRTIKLFGIDKAIWNLTGGWGTPNFSTIIDSINSMGFLSGRYDIFTDVWPPEHPDWSYRTEGYPEDVIVGPNGDLQKGWLAYQNNIPFQGYYTCAETHLAYAQKHIPVDLATNRYNARFIDVETASSLVECYSTVHPTTRKQDAEARNRLLSYVKNDLNLVTGSEEAHDFAFANADYGEGTMTIVPAANAGYDWSTPLDPTDKTYQLQNISPEMRIPLHGLVYHDVHIPTWYTGDGATKVPAFWDDKNLWNILYGSMPLFMPPSAAYWSNNLEKFISSYHLISTVTRNVGYSKMIDHEFLSSDRMIQQTTFDNGWNVIVNFDTIPHGLNNQTLAPKGFYASGGENDEAFKLIIDDKTIGGAISGNRLFFNPFAVEASWKGLRTTQSVFMQKFPDYLLLSFIGTQNYIDISIPDLPFDVTKISNVSEYYTGVTTNMRTLSDGWIRITRPSGKSFFKLYYQSKTNGSSMRQTGSSVRIFPNPARNQLIIEQSTADSYMTICNLYGQKVLSKSLSEIKTQLNIRQLVSGMYIMNLVQNGSCEVRKFVKQ